MEEKEKLSELGSFGPEKKTILGFVNGVIEKTDIDSSDTCTLKGLDPMVTICSKDDFR